MKLIDQKIFETKKQDLFDKLMSAPETTFSAKENPEEASALDKEVFDLIVELFAILKGLDPENLQIRQELEPYVRERMADFDPDNPDATYAAKIIRLLASGRLGSATYYADALGEHKGKEFCKDQADRATGLRPSSYGKFLESLLLGKPNITEEQALNRIHNQKSVYPIFDSNDEWIWVYTSEEEVPKDFPKTKQYKVSALGSNLSQARKNLRKFNKAS
jgi:hypothetical protein